jgi:hypothetical protein
MCQRQKANELIRELRTKRLEELHKKGKINSIKDLCRYGFCPAILINTFQKTAA